MKKIICSIITMGMFIGLLLGSDGIVAKAETTSNLDTNKDGEINLVNLANVESKYNIRSKDAGWSADYDFNKDNIIDIYDLVKVSLSIEDTIDPNQDITNKFTDDNFREAVYNLIEKSSNEPILYSDVKDIKTLDISCKKISNLDGIEFFKSLKILYCNQNSLTNLNFSNNKELTYLNCSQNQLESLNINSNIKLTSLICDINNLTTLDVSKNTELIKLICSNNKLTKLDVSNNTALTKLLCSDNKLTSLDISKNPELHTMNCTYNELKYLYSTKTSWPSYEYVTQYVDESHDRTTDDLVITIKK